jgi:hypothetical protein
MSVRVIVFVLVAGAVLAAPASAENLKIQKDWRGEIGEEKAKEIGETLIVVNQKAWEKFWKSVKPKDKVPAVDFEKQAVLVMAGRKLKISSLDLSNGDVMPDASGTFDGAIEFHAVAFERKGVKSVWKKALPRE